jgi:hypothetical protein
MLEEAAQGKWCPFARVEGANRTVKGAAPKSARAATGTLCITSDCMMWQSDLGVEGKRRGDCMLRRRSVAS